MNATLSPYMGAPVDVVTSARGAVVIASFVRHAEQFGRRTHQVAASVWCNVGVTLSQVSYRSGTERPA